jgi:hypothetical protein
MMFLFSIVLSLLLGYLSCRLFFSEVKTIDPRFLFNLSFPIGVGLLSVVFISLNLLGLPFWCIILIEIGLIIFLFLKVRNAPKIIYEFERINLNKLILTPILLLATVIYFYSWIIDVGIYFFDTIQSPHGLWDAWSCWNLNAKFISNAPHEWPHLFHQMNPIDFAPDHPLLQKAFIAHCWLLMQNENVWVPVVSSFIFTFCTIGLLSSSVKFFTNKTEGLIAGLIMLCTPFFMVMGDSQYADNTVGFFYFATIVLLTFARRSGTIQPRLLIAAGITSGLAAWSKSEGLMFIVCLFASQLVLVFFKNNRKQLFSELKYLVLGMLPILILVAYFKIAIAPPNRIVTQEGGIPYAKLMDPARYKIAFDWFVHQFNVFGKWSLPFNIWWLFLLGIVFRGGINLKENIPSIISNFILISLMLIGFFLVELITPRDLVWYLSTSVHRLLFQLFPSFIFIYFLALKKTKTKTL